MNQKPEFADSDLARWKEALSSGSAIRFEQGSATLVVHTLEELEAYLQLDPGTLVPVSLQLEESLATVDELREALAAAQARIQELENAPKLPENALELLMAIKGVGEKLADEILSVLTSTATTD